MMGRAALGGQRNCRVWRWTRVAWHRLRRHTTCRAEPLTTARDRRRVKLTAMASANTRRSETHGDVETDAPAAPVIVVLGRCTLIRGGGPVALAPASQRLLAYVALAGRVVSRDRAVGVLWSTVPEQQAHTNLRSALARLRTRAPGVLRAD